MSYTNKQVADVQPGKGFTTAESNEHQRNWDRERWERGREEGNYDPSRARLNFEVAKGGVVRPIDTSLSIPQRMQQRLSELGIEDPNKGLESPKFRTVAKFIFGGSRERMHELAFGGTDVVVAHVPMAVHKNAKNILVFGAGDGGVIDELVKYSSLERIDLVEINDGVIEACRQFFPDVAASLDDPRVNLYTDNALRFIRHIENEYDLIIVDSAGFYGPGESLLTREFYGSCYKALKEDGIMVNQHQSPFYEEDRVETQKAHKRILNNFPISRVYQAHIPSYPSGYWLFGFASKKYHPVTDLDADYWNGLGIATDYYTTNLHVGCFALPAYVERALRDVEKIKD